MTPATVRIVFMGTPEFAVPPLRALAAAGYNVVAAICQPDRPVGRGGKVASPPVKLAALELGIPVLQPENLRGDEIADSMAALGADVFVVAAYGHIIPKRILALPKRGSLNVHASLLPRWRGASPINAAIRAGDTESGVTIMEVVAKMDAGPIVAARAVPIAAGATALELERDLSRLGADLLVEVLPAWYEREIAASPQDEALVTYCHLLTKGDGALDASQGAQEAERTVRAMNPWPGAFLRYGGERLAVWRAHIPGIQPELADVAPGTLRFFQGDVLLRCADGWLALDEIQRPGGKRLAGRDFVNGERGRGGLRDRIDCE